MIKIEQAIIVEGKYDKIKLSSIIDAVIITTDGFNIFKDKEKLELIKYYAEKTGIIIMTDSDSAGFLIRNHIRGAIKNGKIINVYIPDIMGKEKRKIKPSAEGKLGVEGIDCKIILDAFDKAGVMSSAAESRVRLTKTDLFELGLSGGKNSSEKRKKLLKFLRLPSLLTPNSMLEVLNTMMDRKELENILSTPDVSATDKALEAFVWGARGQFFWDGNKRTSLMLANKILVSSGSGIMTITDKYMEQFNTLLLNYYNTGESEELKQFLYKNAIQGIRL